MSDGIHYIGANALYDSAYLLAGSIVVLLQNGKHSLTQVYSAAPCNINAEIP